MGVKIDYVNKIDTSAINPINPNEGIDVVYLTGAGYIDYPFRGISRDSALGWEEAAWGGELTRSVSNFVMTNITDVNYGLVARLELSYKYMNVSEYKVLMEISKQRVCYATYFNRETGKWVLRQEMAFTENGLGKLYAFGENYIGTMDVKIKLVATNRDKAEKKCTISFNKNNANAAGTIADETIDWSDNFCYDKISKKTGNTAFALDGFTLNYFSTKADGTGLKYLPNQEITAFDDLTLYAIWSVIPTSSLSYETNETGLTVTGVDSTFAGGEIKIGREYNGIKITKIAPAAFANKTNITSIYIDDNNFLEEIGGASHTGAFERCSNITNVYIGKSNTLKSIGATTFIKCTNITIITPPDSIEYIYFAAFNMCSSLQKINMPASLKYISGSAFAGCSSLNVDINIPNVESIGDKAFSGCSLLNTDIDLSNVTTIGDEAFSECNNIKSFYNAKKLQVIGMRAFKECNSITSFDIPNSITSLGYHPFESCASLSKVNIYITKNINIGENRPFYGVNSNTILHIPISISNPTETYGWGWNLYGSDISNTLSYVNDL